MPRLKTTLILPSSGIEVEVEAHFQVTAWPTMDTYFEPGDPAEIEIEEVFGVHSDLDMSPTLAREIYSEDAYGHRTSLLDYLEGYILENVDFGDLYHDDRI